MAERKRPTSVLTRDEAFIQRVEAAPRKYSGSFRKKVESVAEEKIAPSAINHVAHTTNHIPDTAPDADALTLQETKRSSPVKEDGGAITSNSRPRNKATVKRTDKGDEKKPPALDADDTEQVKIYFSLPAHIVERADKWAAVARCPSKKIVMSALGNHRNSLIEKISGLKHTDIPEGRAVESAMRVSTTWTLEREVCTKVSKELDPEGFSTLSVHLSKWVREEFLDYLDEFLSKAGY